MITIYKSAFEKSGFDTNLSTISKLIKSNKFKSTIHQLRQTSNDEEKKRLKSNLPCATFYGTYRENKLASSIQTTNGLMVFDYDELKTSEQAKQIKRMFNKKYNRYIHMMFVSPSCGVKVVFKTNIFTKDNDYYVYCYNKLRSEIESTLNIKLDHQTCNINRLTYLSHDDDCIYNEDSDVYSLNLESEYKEKETRRLRELQKQSDYLNSQEIDTDKKLRFGKKAVRDYLNKYNMNGSRHHGSYVLAMQLYSYGFTVIEVTREFEKLKQIKAFTDPDAKKRASDIYLSWKAKGKLSSYVLKHDKKSLKSFVSAFSI